MTKSAKASLGRAVKKAEKATVKGLKTAHKLIRRVDKVHEAYRPAEFKPGERTEKQQANDRKYDAIKGAAWHSIPGMPVLIPSPQLRPSRGAVGVSGATIGSTIGHIAGPVVGSTLGGPAGGTAGMLLGGAIGGGIGAGAALSSKRVERGVNAIQESAQRRKNEAIHLENAKMKNRRFLLHTVGNQGAKMAKAASVDPCEELLKVAAEASETDLRSVIWVAKLAADAEMKAPDIKAPDQIVPPQPAAKKPMSMKKKLAIGAGVAAGAAGLGYGALASRVGKKHLTGLNSIRRATGIGRNKRSEAYQHVRGQRHKSMKSLEASQVLGRKTQRLVGRASDAVDRGIKRVGSFGRALATSKRPHPIRSLMAGLRGQREQDGHPEQQAGFSKRKRKGVINSIRNALGPGTQPQRRQVSPETRSKAAASRAKRSKKMKE